jgi:hypothetical protein
MACSSILSPSSVSVFAAKLSNFLVAAFYASYTYFTEIYPSFNPVFLKGATILPPNPFAFPPIDFPAFFKLCLKPISCPGATY